MWSKGIKGCMVVALVCGMCNACFAGELSVTEEIRQLKSAVQLLSEKFDEQCKIVDSQSLVLQAQDKRMTELSQFEEKLHRQEGSPIPLAEGLEIGVGATMVLQGVNHSNYRASADQKTSHSDASYSADITLGKQYDAINAKAFAHLEAGQGAGIENELTLFSNVNRDADDDANVRLTELWYEQGLLDGKAVLIFGKLDPTIYFDNNAVANDETTQFLGRIFRNNPVIEFCDNAPGIRLAYSPASPVEIDYGIFDGDNNGENADSDTFMAGQVTVKPGLFGREGNYRFMAWRNDTPHTAWLSPGDIAETACGYALSFDQEIANALTLFCRYGYQDPRVYNPGITAAGGFNYSLEQSWSGGLQAGGNRWGRDSDAIAFAVGQIVPSGDYKRADPARRAGVENHFELYYKAAVNEHLSITPDIQFITNPFGDDVVDGANNILVAGARLQVDF